VSLADKLKAHFRKRVRFKDKFPDAVSEFLISEYQLATNGPMYGTLTGQGSAEVVWEELDRAIDEFCAEFAKSQTSVE